MPVSKPQSPMGKLENDPGLASASPWRVETSSGQKHEFELKMEKEKSGLS